MPRKNSRKIYVEDGYYHIYNRGVEKRPIFFDDQDYGTFLSYLKESLLPKNDSELRMMLSAPNMSAIGKSKIARALRLQNFADQISMIAYCLMPNHFHFLVKQRQPTSIDGFMKSLGTRYAMYFNKRYGRVGPLYQGVYRAVLVRHDSQFLHLSRYIHNQALKGRNQPSSLAEYLGGTKAAWVHPEEVLSFFSQTIPSLSYRQFLDSYEESNTSELAGLTLEEA